MNAAVQLKSTVTQLRLQLFQLEAAPKKETNESKIQKAILKDFKQLRTLKSRLAENCQRFFVLLLYNVLFILCLCSTLAWPPELSRLCNSQTIPTIKRYNLNRFIV